MNKKKKNNPFIRHDLQIVEESESIFISSYFALKQAMEDEQLGPQMFSQNLSIGQELVEHDRGFNARIVFKSQLAEEEKNWVGCVTGILKVPCGKLIVSRGFFAKEPFEAIAKGKYQHDALHCVEIPAGEYRIDLYTYLPCINAQGILAEVKLGAWFRDSHKEKPFPLWLAAVCEESPTQDPKHKKLWKNWKKALEEGKLVIDRNDAAYIDFVVQLSTIDGEVPLSLLEEEGAEELGDAFSYDAGARKIKKCPLGIRSQTLSKWDYCMFS